MAVRAEINTKKQKGFSEFSKKLKLSQKREFS